MEPRPTHHPSLVSSSPSVRSGIRRDCAAGTHRSRPERPALTLTLIAFGRRYGQDKLIVKLAERKLFVTFTNVTTGSGATGSVFAVLPSPGPALCSAASLRIRCRRALLCVNCFVWEGLLLAMADSGHSPGLVGNIAVLVRSERV